MKIQRASLGRIASPGDLYNACTDTFCGTSILRGPVPEPLFEVVPSPLIRCDVKYANSRSERCKHLGLQNELQLSVLGRNLPLSGSADYLAADTYKEGETTVSLVHRNRTVVEKLNMFCEDAKRVLSLENAVEIGATHVVLEVEWGVVSVLALSFRAINEEQKEEFSKTLSKLMLRKLDEEVHKTHVHQKSYAGFPVLENARLEFYTDIALADHQKPQSLEECALLLRSMTAFLNESSKMTKPIVYTLLPLNVLELVLGGTVGMQRTLAVHDESTTNNLVNFLDSMIDKECSLGKFVQKLRQNHQFFNAATIDDISKWIKDVAEKIKCVKLEIGKNMELFRLGEIKITDIETGLECGRSLLEEVDHFFAEFYCVEEKLAYITRMNKLGISVAVDFPAFQELLKNGEYFVFVTNLSLMDKTFLQNADTFEKLCLKNSQKCLIFDNDIHRLEGLENHSILYYIGGLCFEENVCRLDSLLQDSNVVKFGSVIQANGKKPNPRVKVEVVCPKSLCSSGCNKKKREWVCYHCQKAVEYGFNKRFYCDCGEIDPFSASWFCQDDCHGPLYAEFDADALEKELKEIKKCKEFNILLVGETGAGKSTWINSIANYVIHESLRAASLCPLTCLIPSSFAIQTAAQEVRKVQVGESDNETFIEGQSATQKPKTYTFMYNNVLIRLIDVPGVCDTRGPEQDKKNFNLILQELRTITELHAICVLLAPDATRLTLAFQYCISELLTHLHKNAAKNIVFCFTKTRQTFYRAGQTLPILKEYLNEFEKRRKVRILLEKDTMYYFDNEAFRLLCAIRDGVNFTEKEQEAYEESWNISATETARFLNYVLNLEPHLTRDMLSLNEARRIIVTLTGPLANITENINTNLRLLKDSKKEFEELGSSVCDLEARLHIKQVTLDAMEIDYPRTVCASKNCIETRRLPQSGVTTVHYKQTCHERCYLENIEVETYPNPGLKYCWAMRNGRSDTCQVCKCGWDFHLHVKYLQELREITVIDPTTQELLNEKRTRKIKKQDVLAAYDRQIAELEKRHRRITEICANFGAFLDRNSIVPYNDALTQYLEYAIKLADQEAAITNERTRADELRSYLDRYKQELNILKNNLTAGTQNITLEDVMKMKAELYSMNSPDCNIASYLKVMEDAYDKHYSRKDTYFDADGFVIGRTNTKKLSRASRVPCAASTLLTRSLSAGSASSSMYYNNSDVSRMVPFGTILQDQKEDKTDGWWNKFKQTLTGK